MNILGIHYKMEIIPVTAEDSKHLGNCNIVTSTIKICRGLSQQQKESTVIHEILEAIDYSMGLNLDERDIRALEVGVYQVLVENKINLTPLVAELE